ncbi:uncharacterized protein C8Q71DRAFT_408254 [Rhodofomes roseus]|uniref:MFS transporter n=1 Tax=Rhodofomes roseus TaxID=34475 RepID=A0ABQ8JYP2_9APHY|nr:uncharacterized protein C8Q71DRAFT_408254 [Rhodofomes roseus]KAH9829350.1 hypothetical protein C8Q71DRAFT_408254 [Rhodofomes roseus]
MPTAGARCASVPRPGPQARARAHVPPVALHRRPPFRARRALAVGIAISDSSASGVVFPIMLNRLFQDPTVGFANAVRASGAVVGGCLVAANCLMPARLPLKRAVRIAEKDGSRCAARLEGVARHRLGRSVLVDYMRSISDEHRGVCPAFLSPAVRGGPQRQLVYHDLLPCDPQRRKYTRAARPHLPRGQTRRVQHARARDGRVRRAHLCHLRRDERAGRHPRRADLRFRVGVKMGLAYTAVAAANLIGNPIAGALLRTSTGGPLTWWRAIVFTGCVAAVGAAVYGVVEITVHQRAREGWAEGLRGL